ncbi:MAG: hypothetical protein AAFX94_15735, partial [Myxococcota bacterium]
MSEFSSEEQRALETWTTAPAAAGLTFAVLREVAAERRRRGLLAVGSAVLAAAVTLSLIASPLRWPTAGEWQAQERETVTLGHRGIAVAERGSEAQWSVAYDGSTWIKQESGSVFYRVEPGGSFEVNTPAGTVVATGTCFRVEVVMKQILTSAAAGLVVGAATVVTVYEGSVDVSGSVAGEKSLSAGESVEIADGKPLAVSEAYRRGPAAVTPAVRVEKASPGVLERFIALEEGAAPSRAQHVAAVREVERLQHRVAALESELEDRKEHGRKTYDIPEEELIRMAEDCEVTYDWQPPSDRVSRVSDDSAEALELDAEQRSEINRVFENTNDRLAQELRDLYVELTGDPNVGSLSFDAIMGEIRDKTPVEEIRRVMQRLSSERAGLMVPPEDLTETSVYERYL